MSVVVLGETSAERRPKLLKMLREKIPGIEDSTITKLRYRGIDAFFEPLLANAASVMMPPPRDVDTEDVRLRTDKFVWNSLLLDKEEHGEFPWAGVKPLKSQPFLGYESFFLKYEPNFKYPDLEHRRTLWSELLSHTPYQEQCGPFEVVLPPSARPFITKKVLYSLKADLPQGIRVASKPIDATNPHGAFTMAMGLASPFELQEYSALHQARVKSDLLRSFSVLQYWASAVECENGGRVMDIETFFAEACYVDINRMAATWPGRRVPPPPSAVDVEEDEEQKEAETASQQQQQQQYQQILPPSVLVKQQQPQPQQHQSPVPMQALQGQVDVPSIPVVGRSNAPRPRRNSRFIRPNPATLGNYRVEKPGRRQITSGGGSSANQESKRPGRSAFTDHPAGHTSLENRQVKEESELEVKEEPDSSS